MKFLYRLLVLVILLAILGLQLYFYKRLNEVDKIVDEFSGDVQDFSREIQKENQNSDFWKYTK